MSKKLTHINRIVKIIKGKKGYFIQRSDAQLTFDKKLKQHVYETEFIGTDKLVQELREQLEESKSEIIVKNKATSF